MTAIERFLKPPSKSFFLFGARGTGKSTWLRTHFKNEKYINLLDEAKYQTLLAEPGLFYEELKALKPKSWVLVDEVQRLPPLLNEVHRLIEEQSLSFALTGSSARKLRRSGVNLLAGRAVRREMFPLTPMELGGDFKLGDALTFGTLPLVYFADDRKDTLTHYVQMYLKEEIQAEAIVQNLSGFSRFLPIAALFHGQVLNLSNIARDAEVKRPTAQGFFEILEDTLLAKRLPALETKLRVRERKHPKFYFIDAGVARAARKNLHPISDPEKGPLLEGLVFMMLCFQKEIHREIDAISYWSPAEAKLTEVDFVVQKNRELIAIEVKATARLRPEHFLGLTEIKALKQVRRRVLVYLGSEKRIHDGIEILPFDTFVAELLKKKI